MNRLIWSDFLGYYFIKKKTVRESILMNLPIVMLYCAFFYFAIITGYGHIAIFMMIVGHFLEDKNVPNVMYMIPGTIEDYLYTRLKFAIKLQMGILLVIELVRNCILIVRGAQGELVEELFMVIATVLYSIINSVYTFYRTYTYKPLYKETWGMAALVPYCIIVCLRPEYGDNVPVILLIRVLFVVLFAGWAYYICRFVKKNILLTTYYGGENT